MTYRIEIAASIAAGKSTLCDGLRRHGFEIIPERLEENPFLTRAYDNPAARGIDVMAAFILSKASALATYKGPAPVIVADYALIAEYAYNDQHLKSVSPAGHRLCRQLIDLKRQQVGEPDILIVIDCPAERQLERIKARGRDFEQGLDRAYLQKLNDSLRYYIDEETVSGTRIMRIDSDRYDLRDPAVVAAIALEIRRLCPPKAAPRPAP